MRYATKVEEVSSVDFEITPNLNTEHPADSSGVARASLSCQGPGFPSVTAGAERRKSKEDRATGD